MFFQGLQQVADRYECRLWVCPNYLVDGGKRRPCGGRCVCYAYAGSHFVAEVAKKGNLHPQHAQVPKRLRACRNPEPAPLFVRFSLARQMAVPNLQT